MADNHKLLQELINAVEDKAASKTIEDLRIGLCYTGVLLSDGHLGLAYTFKSPHSNTCCVRIESGSFKGKRATEVIRCSLSDNLLESSIGIATINALANQTVEEVIEGDVLDIVTFHPSDTVGMIGFFGPLVGPLRASVKSLFIFEEKDMPHTPDVYPSARTVEILPQCDVIIISATTLINKTMEPLLQLSKNARETIILGATTPLIPRTFISRGITMLSGVVVVDTAKVLRVISEGGGMRDFKNIIKKVNLILKKV